jgi:beta-lactamase class A
VLSLLLLMGSINLSTPPGPAPAPVLPEFTLDYHTSCDIALQAGIEACDLALRARHGMTAADTAVGVLDLRQPRVAMVRPDRIEYAASVPKIGILLAYFVQHPGAAHELDPTVRRELELMIKQSSNELAAKYSRELGLAAIRQVLDAHHFYDAARGGGLWVGKHYGASDERLGDPVADHSHAATVRQLLRFYLLLEQDRLVSPAASRTMREIFAAPGIPHDEIKFVKGLAGRPVTLRRKSGTWEHWFHDTAVVTGPGRHYILVALTHHPRGDAYLEELAAAVDDLLTPGERTR